MSEALGQFAWPKIGQERVVSFLEKSILAQKIANTYIFAGLKDLGKHSLALAFAHNLWRQDLAHDNDDDAFKARLNSDLCVLQCLEDKQQISVNQAREFVRQLSLASFFNSYKIGIIKEADRLSLEAQNALLKTLEEPRTKVVIILLTESPDKLLATILSRSQLLYFYPVSKDVLYDYLLDEVPGKRSQAQEISALAEGRPLRALQWLQEPEQYQAVLELQSSALDFILSDLSHRFAWIKDNIGDSPEREKIILYLQVWENLWRDALLFSLNQIDRLRYPALKEQWQKLQTQNPHLNLSKTALASLQVLQASRQQLQGAINPKNILDNLAIYF